MTTAVLDRAALGRIVFADRSARADLEAIVHPEVYRRIGEWFADLPPDTRVAIADIPLLFETGHEHDFDRVIVSACAPAEQLRRLMARDGLNEPTPGPAWTRSGRSRKRSRARTTSSGPTARTARPRGSAMVYERLNLEA